jgi:hypothetical protein
MHDNLGTNSRCCREFFIGAVNSCTDYRGILLSYHLGCYVSVAHYLWNGCTAHGLIKLIEIMV